MQSSSASLCRPRKATFDSPEESIELLVNYVLATAWSRYLVPVEVFQRQRYSAHRANWISVHELRAVAIANRAVASVDASS